MKQLTLIATLCLLSGIAAADFQLTDPAAMDENPGTAVAEMEGDYATEGAGVKTCDVYRIDRKSKSSMHYINLNWAKGFISGVNFIHAETRGNTQLGTGLDQDALTLWLDNYCNDNPGKTLSDASAALVNTLMN
ncbi:MAG: hypothetical protein WBN41_11365 [Lysobacterales bacterium]